MNFWDIISSGKKEFLIKRNAKDNNKFTFGLGEVEGNLVNFPNFEILETFVIDSKKEAETRLQTYFLLKYRKPETAFNARGGWITPFGEFYPCTVYETACLLVALYTKDREKYLAENNGAVSWIFVENDGRIKLPKEEPTMAQLDCVQSLIKNTFYTTHQENLAIGLTSLVKIRTLETTEEEDQQNLKVKIAA